MFLEVPGTQLSLGEASRLSGLEAARCEPILDALPSASLVPAFSHVHATAPFDARLNDWCFRTDGRSVQDSASEV